MWNNTLVFFKFVNSENNNLSYRNLFLYKIFKIKLTFLHYNILTWLPVHNSDTGTIIKYACSYIPGGNV